MAVLRGSVGAGWRASKAGGVSVVRRPALQQRWCRLPPVAEPAGEQLIGRGLVGPYSDRCELSHSGDADGEPAAVSRQLDQEVVVELVMTDDIDAGTAEVASLHPGEDIADAAEAGKLVSELRVCCPQGIAVVGVLHRVLSTDDVAAGAGGLRVEAELDNRLLARRALR